MDEPVCRKPLSWDLHVDHGTGEWDMGEYEHTTRAAVRTLPSAKAHRRRHLLARTCCRQRVFLR